MEKNVVDETTCEGAILTGGAGLLALSWGSESTMTETLIETLEAYTGRQNG